MPTTITDKKLDPSSLVPYERNPKAHPPEQITLLVRSMQEVGFTQPILVDEDHVVIVGHGRRLAAIEAGLSKVPVRVIAGLSPEQKRALRITDNKLSLLGAWIPALLHSELSELSELAVDLGSMGFSDEDMARLSDDAARAALSDDGETEHDDTIAPEIPRADGMVNINIPVAALDRQVIFDAIQRARDKHGLDTSGEALVAISQDFLTRNPS
jgi:ParB-like chromosome segregation protein Spo0J